MGYAVNQPQRTRLFEINVKLLQIIFKTIFIRLFTVQVAVLILLLLGLAELFIVGFYRLKRRWLEERRKTAQLFPARR